MAERRKKEPRYAYVKDPELTETGFTTYEKASEAYARLAEKYGSVPEFRVKTRLRSRTGLWDVLVKRRTELPDATGEGATDGD